MPWWRRKTRDEREQYVKMVKRKPKTMGVNQSWEEIREKKEESLALFGIYLTVYQLLMGYLIRLSSFGCNPINIFNVL